MLGSEAMGAPPYKGEQRTRRPHHLRARSRPNLPSYESLYGLSRTGLRKRPSGGKCKPLRKIFAALVGFHRRFIATRYRRGCPAVALQSRGLHYTAAGFVLRTVKRRLAPRPLPEIERAHHLHHASSAGRWLSCTS